MLIRKYSLIIIAFAFFSCCTRKQSSSPDYMVLDQIVFATKFSQEIQLFDSDKIEMDETIGALNFTSVDSLLIFSTSNSAGMWSFFSNLKYEWRGRFLLRGNGPNEFVQTPTVGAKTSFYTKDNEFFASIYDFTKGKVYVMNISRTLGENKLVIRLINDELPPFLSSLIMIDSVTFFCREVSKDQSKEERFLLKNGVRNVPDVLNKLNKAVMSAEATSVQAAIIKRNGNNERFVEVPLNLNYINIYSIDGAFAKTICTQNRLDNISDVQKQKTQDRIYRHADLQIYDYFFGVLCIDEEWKMMQTERKKLPVVQFFNMDGKPLVKLTLNNFATSFSIDINNGYLYTFDFVTSEFYRYDIQNIVRNYFRF